MEGPTNFIEIPGYAEALRREDRLRRQAWTGTTDLIAGVTIRPLTWRDIETLAELRNGFFCPWKFETDGEYLGHCAHLVWWLSDCRKPAQRGETRLGVIIIEAHKARIIRHLGKHPRELVEGVMRFLSDTFADGPRGGGSTGRGTTIAGGPAYIADTMAAAGYSFTIDQLLDMPVTRLFQLLRLANRRLYNAPAVNQSDIIASDYLAQINAGKN